MTTVIKTTSVSGTYLKVTPDFQASAPQNDGKEFVPPNTELTLSNIGPVEKKHRKITLTKFNESKDWYIYDPHWAIVVSDDPDHLANIPQNKTIIVKPVSKYSSFVQKQIDSLIKYSPTGVVDLDTSCVYFSQRDNDVMPHRTCNSSSNAMYLNWLQRASGQSKVLTDDDVFVQSVLKRGDTIYHSVITEALKAYGFNTYWNTDGDYSKLKDIVSAGFVVPVNILHRGTKRNPRGGHIISLVGYRQSGDWITMDPYGTLDSGYTDVNGKHAFLSKADFEARWQGGSRYLA